MTIPTVALVQDHLVQRGGAERAFIAMSRALPYAARYATFYAPELCYPEIETLGVRSHPLNRISAVRHHHRATAPILPAVMSTWRVPADVLLCATSGWAQGVRTQGRKILYFHSLARWVHEPESYLRNHSLPARTAARLMNPPLRAWDRRTVLDSHRFITAGSVMARWVKELYGVDAEVLPVPPGLEAAGPRRPVEGLEPGFFLCPARLLAYKNIDVLLEAFAELPERRLVVAGDGPLLGMLRGTAPPNVSILGAAEDETLRWLYETCAAVVSAAYEPFGLGPVEAGAFGKPSIVLRGGGFLDTVSEGETGVLFDHPSPVAVVDAIRRFDAQALDPAAIRAKAGTFGADRFAERLQAIVAEEQAALHG